MAAARRRRWVTVGAVSAREFIALGTSSQLPTRHRAHNSYALRWDDQLVIFDPGEGAQRQCTLAGVSIAKVTAVCVTHFHGDHCLGLPGVIQRRSLDNATNSVASPPLPVIYPGDGQDFFDRMRQVSIFHDRSDLVPSPVEADGPHVTLGDVELSARELDHRVTTYGYRLQEPDRVRVDPERLAATGLAGPDVGRLLKEGSIDGPNGRVQVDEVTEVRSGQSMAFVMDTRLCDAALELAQGVDLLVCESTYLHEHLELAEQYAHMTARQAGELAARAGVRRLVLTHFSSRYTDVQVMAEEAGQYHDDVVAVNDLDVVQVPGPTR